MEKFIKAETMKAMIFFGDTAMEIFYRKTAERKFETTRCADCGYLFFPPRSLCVKCGSQNLKWAALSGRGKLYAFSWQERSLRFPKPDVIGIVELEEENLWAFTRIVGKYEDLKIGMPVRVDFVEVLPGFVLHQFMPE
ncbi:MAG: OB-fold domain-containing protein [bacterium]